MPAGLPQPPLQEKNFSNLYGTKGGEAAQREGGRASVWGHAGSRRGLGNGQRDSPCRVTWGWVGLAWR